MHNYRYSNIRTTGLNLIILINIIYAIYSFMHVLSLYEIFPNSSIKVNPITQTILINVLPNNNSLFFNFKLHLIIIIYVIICIQNIIYIQIKESIKLVIFISFNKFLLWFFSKTFSNHPKRLNLLINNTINIFKKYSPLLFILLMMLFYPS